MNSVIEGEITVKFVGAGLSKKGKPWLRVSNGLETKFLGTEVHPDDFEAFSEGDEFTAIVSVDAFDPFKTKVLQLLD